MADLLVTTTKVIDYIKDKHQAQTSGELPEALSKKVQELIDAAVTRCKANGRTVVKPKDF